MSSTTPHHIFIDNTVEYISLEDAVEVINTKNNEIRWLKEKVSTIIKLAEEKDDYINKLEVKTTNWVINLKETIKEKDQLINYLEEELEEMKYPMRDYKLELLKYFHDNQYDEERFPHFRNCDRHIEYDDEGNIHPTYTFYG